MMFTYANITGDRLRLDSVECGLKFTRFTIQIRSVSPAYRLPDFVHAFIMVRYYDEKHMVFLTFSQRNQFSSLNANSTYEYLLFKR